MHEGVVDSGHYYSYIHNHWDKTWFRYSDSNVTPELDEEKIMREAYGYKFFNGYKSILKKISILNINLYVN